MPNRSLLSALASAFLAGEQTVEQVVARGIHTLGKDWRWLGPLAKRYLDNNAGKTRPRRRDVIQFLREDRGFNRARLRYAAELSIHRWLHEPQRMHPVPAATAWPVPAIESAGALSEWLAARPTELAWFADLKALGRKRRDRPKLGHYFYRVFTKRSGSVRLIESPKPRLKEMQRRILAGILDNIPHHSAVHGFVKDRSIKTFAAPHVGQRIVLRMDLQEFFPSLSGARIQALFRTIGYPEPVADLLGGLCTNAAPAQSLIPFETRALYSRPHLPQGAPTSPALANLCAWRLDRRLTGLAKAADAQYTRYADDLAFSGGEAFERCADRFSTHVAAIVREEGFSVNHRKTRIMRQGVRQHLAGLVTNQRVNVVRADFDRLKAILTNCARLGPESQNRDGLPSFRSHLEGRVGFVEMIHPAKGKRLREIFERIAW